MRKGFIRLAASAVAADQITKVLASVYLKPMESCSLAPFLSLTYVENTGISFGLLKGFGNRFFVVLNSLLACGLLWHYGRQKKRLSRLADFGLAIIIAGALGNLVDRLTRGHVIDFIDLHWWPVFNLADSMITIGIGLYAAGTLKK